MKIIKHLKQIKQFFTNTDEIISIEEYREVPVIDIEVTGNHLFYANDLLTHNSSSAAGYAGADISMSNTSDSAGINMDADALFALFQLEGERELGRINVKILKNRLGGFVDTIFPMSVNYDTLKISDWGSFEDDEFDEIGGINTTSNNIGKNNVNTGKNNINNLFDED